MRRRAANHAPEADHRIESTGISRSPRGLWQLEGAGHIEDLDAVSLDTGFGQGGARAGRQLRGNRVVEPGNDHGKATA